MKTLTAKTVGNKKVSFELLKIEGTSVNVKPSVKFGTVHSEVKYTPVIDGKKYNAITRVIKTNDNVMSDNYGRNTVTYIVNGKTFPDNHKKIIEALIN